MVYILVRLFAPLINLFTFIVNCFIWRDKRIVLFGAWMGDKFTDNPRYLYQYLYEHKDEYDVKKVVWVTRNQYVYNMLQGEGYEVYMMHSLQSYYYHFKAGVHFICNISFPVKGYDGDIMGQLSGHALKINMFHGVAIKAGKSTGEVNKTRGVIGKVRFVLRHNRMFNDVFTPGHWDKAYQLSTSKECSRRDAMFCGVDEKWFLETGYPRNCEVARYTEEEERIVKLIKSHGITILYVPTFRESGEVPHPLSDEKLIRFLIENDFLWVEKQHPASKNAVKIENLEANVLYLDKSFDINIIIPVISLLVSDYSSVTYDAMAFDKPVIYYVPDYDYYLTNERGFLCDYKELVGGFEAETIDELIFRLDCAFNDDSYQKLLSYKVQKEKSSVLCDNKSNCGEIIQSINHYLDVLKKL